ncbi:hypothetical protein Hanom_Chr03g00233831 [Helianthus anomalus]
MLQTTFVSNANPLQPPAKPDQSVGSSAQTYSEAFYPKAFLPQPQVVTPQVRQQAFDLKAFLPQPQVATSQVPQHAFYGNNFQPSNPNTVRLNTSNLSKVSVEVAKEHMEL